MKLSRKRQKKVVFYGDGTSPESVGVSTSKTAVARNYGNIYPPSTPESRREKAFDWKGGGIGYRWVLEAHVERKGVRGNGHIGSGGRKLLIIYTMPKKVCTIFRKIVFNYRIHRLLQPPKRTLIAVTYFYPTWNFTDKRLKVVTDSDFDEGLLKS